MVLASLRGRPTVLGLVASLLGWGVSHAAPPAGAEVNTALVAGMK